MDELQRQINENITQINEYKNKIRDFENKLSVLRYNLQNDYKGIRPTKDTLRKNPHFAQMFSIKKNIAHLNNQIAILTKLNTNLSVSLTNKKKIENRKTLSKLRDSSPTAAPSLNNKEEEEELKNLVESSNQKEEEELKNLVESSTQKETKNRRNNDFLEGLLQNKSKNTPLFSEEDDNINNEINQMHNEDNIQSIREKKQRELEEKKQKKEENQKELERIQNMDLLFKNQLNENYNKSNLKKTKKSTKINKTRKTRKNIPKEIQMKTFKGHSDEIEDNSELDSEVKFPQTNKPTPVGPIQIIDDELDSLAKFPQINKLKGNKVTPVGPIQIRDGEVGSLAKFPQTNKLTPVGPIPSEDARVAIKLTEEEAKERTPIEKRFRSTLIQTKKNVKLKSKNPNIICKSILKSGKNLTKKKYYLPSEFPNLTKLKIYH